jgi:preprotein translocase subunit SecG
MDIVLFLIALVVIFTLIVILIISAFKSKDTSCEFNAKVGLTGFNISFKTNKQNKSNKKRPPNHR